MGKLPVLPLMLLGVMFLAGTASAAGLHVYKWTDAQGVVHYSDKPPVVKAPDQHLLNLPKLPPVDPQKIAAIEARTAAINAMLKQLHAQEEQQQKQQQVAAQPAVEKVIEKVPEPVLVYPGYGYRPRYGHHFHQDLDDFDHDDFRHGHSHDKPHPSRPTRPLPYNLNNNSPFRKNVTFQPATKR